MTQQTINVSNPNDHAGDSARAAFTKVNENFTEVYALAAANDAAISAEVTARGNAVSGEASARAAADTALAGLITDEATARASAVTAEATARANADALKANLASPALTGVPTAPTAAALTNTTQVATTAFARGEVSTEATARAAADTALDTRVSALEVVRTRVGRVTVDQLAIGTAYTDITNLVFSIEANTTYSFEFTIYADSDATTTGIDVAVNGPASPTFLNYAQGRYSTTQFYLETVATTYDNDTASTGVATTATRVFKVYGIVANGANAGNLAARIKREAVGSGPNVRVGSFGRISKLF